MRKASLLFALAISCSLAAGLDKYVPSSVAFTLEEKDLIPEGIAHDPRTGRFFLSSIFKEKVVAVDASGKSSDFIPSGRDGVMESLGLKIDEKNRRLWVMSNKTVADRRLSAVHVFNADSGYLIKKFVLDQKEPQLFNDLVLLRDGSAYITDTDAYRIYFVPADLSRLELFLPSDELLNAANGIAASPDGEILYVAALKHIILVDLRAKTMRPIGNPSAFPDSGIDGLYYHRGGLVAVVNGVKTLKDVHLARFALCSDGREIQGRTIIDQGNPLFNIPTTAVMTGDDLYCLAGTSLDVFLRNQMSDTEKLKKPTVLKYRLAKS
jgi:sugar lactone lactonase YvrE